jgi:hypothetical protein
MWQYCATLPSQRHSGCAIDTLKSKIETTGLETEDELWEDR